MSSIYCDNSASRDCGGGREKSKGPQLSPQPPLMRQLFFNEDQSTSPISTGMDPIFLITADP